MDGYSVKEAATVLGVPKRRVWELIARGVLSGAPEGDGGMRVFLQPRPGRQAPMQPGRDDPPRTNGNGGHPEGSGEGSPFREILTEFRSLTERYGQALLALGEARGEVAALRSRVELLEARLDLRLPGPRASSTVAWEMPEYAPPPTRQAEPPASLAPDEDGAPRDEAAAPASFDDQELPDASFAESVPAGDDTEPPAPSMADAVQPTTVPEGERPDGPSPRRRRILRSHSAIAGIAEALARAQDPTLADLPGAREAAEALGALQREVEARATTDEAAPPAMAAAPPDATPERVEASFVEPAAAIPAEDLVAEEPPEVSARVAVDEAGPAPEAEAEAEPEPIAEAEPEPIAEAEPEPIAEAEPKPVAEAQAEPLATPEPVADVEATVPDATQDAEAAVGLVTEPAAHEDQPVEAASQSLYTTEVVEPDWFADGDFTWLEAAQAETEAPTEGPVSEAIHEAPAQTEPDAEPQGQATASDEHAREHEEAVPAAEAIQEAFEAPQDDADAALLAAASDEREHERQHAEAAPAAEAIQDAFGPPEAESTEASEEPPSARATPTESAFAPADAVVFTVDRPVTAVAEPAPEEPESPAQEGRAEARAEAPPPSSSPQTATGLGGLAVEAAALPTAHPIGDQRPPEEEELMWLGDEFEAAGLEIATPGWRSQPETSARTAPPAPQPPVHTTPSHEMSDADLAQIAQDEGWDADEVDAIRTLLGRAAPTPPRADEPDADHAATSIAIPVDAPPDDVHPLDEEPVAAEAPVAETTDAMAEQPGEPVEASEPVLSVEETIRRSMAARGDRLPGGAEPEWLRRRRGPAARAYRRLRRLLPG